MFVYKECIGFYFSKLVFECSPVTITLEYRHKDIYTAIQTQSIMTCGAEDVRRAAQRLY